MQTGHTHRRGRAGRLSAASSDAELLRHQATAKQAHNKPACRFNTTFRAPNKGYIFVQYFVKLQFPEPHPLTFGVNEKPQMWSVDPKMTPFSKYAVVGRYSG